ncbi:DUF885 domain-containing protein [Aliiglaciecola litoralis]|uniref:DUF885 domain-containing protein n=1 Tax=Aliiglaciecola litoralis TaxID=582857 RepID=A0ABN1LHB9_9ALTE
MLTRFVMLCCGLILSFILSGCTAKPALSPNTSATSSAPSYSSQLNQADVAFETLLDKSWQMELEFSPERATYLGMANAEQNSRWTDYSLQAMQRVRAAIAATQTELESINPDELSAPNQVNYALFKWQNEMSDKYFTLEEYLMPMNQLSGVQTLDDFANYVPLSTVSDYQNWLTRMERIPAVLEQTQALLELGMQKGMMPPKATMSRIPAQLQSQLVDDPTKSRFYVKFESLPEQFTDDEKLALRQQAQRVIGDMVIPAYRQFNDFFVDKYLPASRDTVGVSALPNGDELYQYQIAYYTTTDMTPEQIHQLGLQEVAKNRREMQKIIEEVKFNGRFDEFIHFLRTDPQFYYDTPEALFEAYLATSKRLDPELTKLFGKLPRMPYGLKAIPDNIAPDTTTAYYQGPSADGLRAGYYFVNLHEPHTRPKYEMEVLSVHEAVPGHHLQIALQMELGELPNFRRYNGFTVFIEGWGLYSERLGYDMGLYQDPYSRFGQLTYDMWRSVRLVVDTGMHAMGWSRQQAIDYFKANAAKSEEDIINEIDRYIAWPGQALAYKIGQLKILELRELATQKLGDKFDIRAFHDVVLGSGSIPLHVLENNVNQWIDDQF